MNEHTSTTQKGGNPRHEFEGTVLTAKDKTIAVLVERHMMHPIYRVPMTGRKRFPVHDEKGEAAVGDRVRFIECRPISKTKRWRLISILQAKKSTIL